jgi:hypothetical protein
VKWTGDLQLTSYSEDCCGEKLELKSIACFENDERLLLRKCKKTVDYVTTNEAVQRKRKPLSSTGKKNKNKKGEHHQEKEVQTLVSEDPGAVHDDGRLQFSMKTKKATKKSRASAFQLQQNWKEARPCYVATYSHSSSDVWYGHDDIHPGANSSSRWVVQPSAVPSIPIDIDSDMTAAPEAKLVDDAYWKLNTIKHSWNKQQ